MTAEEHKADWYLRFKPPAGWDLIRKWGDGWAFGRGGLTLIIDCEIKADGFAWVHVSVSRKHGVPSQDELVTIKEQFVGRDRYAYFVFPPRELYVNLHSQCLHLWARLDGAQGQVLPEFSEELPGIGRSI